MIEGVCAEKKIFENWCFFKCIVYLCGMNGNSEQQNQEDQYYPLNYCIVFQDYLQGYTAMSDGSKLYEGISVDTFLKRHNYSLSDFGNLWKEVLGDSELMSFFKEVFEKCGRQLDLRNMVLLCCYVNELIREHYLVVLKRPTKDAINDLGEINEITFKNKEGKEVTTNNSKLIKAIMTSIEESLDKEGKAMETEKFGRYDKIVDVVETNVLQSRFAYYIATFLKVAFPDADRKHPGKQGMISPTEQKLILRLMSHFGLAPKDITLSSHRFRKLIESYNKLNYPYEYAQVSGIGLIPVTYVKYEDWQGKVDWFDPNLKLKPIEVGDQIYFAEKSIIE